MDGRVVLGLIAISAASVGAYFYFRPSNNATTDTATSSVDNLSNFNYQPLDDLLGDTMQSFGIGTPRGIANNNPLNLKWSAANNWQGQIGADNGGFIKFDTAQNGIRAAARTLKSYQKIGFLSVDQIIRRWTSGDSEAIQQNYVKNVSSAIGISKNQTVDFSQYAQMLAAMIQQENGQQPYSSAQIIAGVNAA